MPTGSLTNTIPPRRADPAIDREPGCIEALRGLAAIALDRIIPKKRWVITALQELARRPPTCCTIAPAVAQAGQERAGAVLYREALNERPEFPEALLNLGHV